MSRHVRLAVITLAAALFHLGVTALALRSASGVVANTDGTVSTEMLDYPTLALALLSVAVLVYVGLTSPPWGVLLTAGLTAISFWGARAEDRRWVESGYSQGLEILAYAVPAGILVLGLFASGLGGVFRLVRGRSTGPEAPTATASPQT
ncbi:MAG TPA: hypothetical protein GXZ60_12270 [Intrasporangiaceae bacterium]|nr:hypothetical protein [Intrasporangiaceae bacterium]